MDLINKFSDKELDMMSFYIRDNAEHGLEAPIQHILRVWENAKSNYLYKLFGEKFIISKDFSYEKSTGELQRELSRLLFDTREELNLAARQFVYDFREKVIDEFWRGREFGISNSLYSLIDTSCLVENVYPDETFEMPIPNSTKTIKVQSGCKILKTLGKIAEAYDVAGFESFRLVHSLALNQKKQKGKLTLSIHPMDYMTMSDNACGWSSCMSWRESGCYRQGTVEMMNSPMVVVAYLTSESDMVINKDTTWNSKKWRELMIVTPEIISGVKSYPYYNETLTFECINWLKELAEKDNFGSYGDVQKFYPFDPTVIDGKGTEVIVSPDTYRMYNDFENINYSFAAFSDTIKEDRRIDLYYSGDSECMTCGSVDCDFDVEESLSGSCCLQYFYCEDCGERFYNEEDVVEVDGDYYCKYCYEHNLHEDALTGEITHRREMKEILLFNLENQEVDYEHLYRIAAWNFDENNIKKLCSKIYRFGYQYFIDIKDLTEEGKDVFQADLFSPMKDSWFFKFTTKKEPDREESFADYCRPFSTYSTWKPYIF